MKKTYAFLISIFLLITLLVEATITASAEDVIQSGTWGTLSWSLNETTGELTISGEGEMQDMFSSTDAWRAHSAKIKSVTIENGVTSIGKSAFYNCTSLASITIPNSVTSIGNYAFQDCTSLASIVVEEGNEVYHSAGNCLIETESKTLLFGCKTSVIPTDGSVTSIGARAFYNCTSLASITIPDSVMSIGGAAFSDCTNLTSITIPDGVTSIGYYAFYGCTNLTSITIPDSVTEINQFVFYNCDNLKAVYYGGTAAEWSNIEIGSIDNESLTSAPRYYYSETQPTESGNYWHYVNGVPTAW